MSFIFVHLEKFSSFQVFQLPVKCYTGYVLHSRPLSTKGSFACHTNYKMGHPFSWTSSRISNISSHMFPTVWGWNFVLFNNSLSLSWQGFVLLALNMQRVSIPGNLILFACNIQYLQKPMTGNGSTRVAYMYGCINLTFIGNVC